MALTRAFASSGLTPCRSSAARTSARSKSEPRSSRPSCRVASTRSVATSSACTAGIGRPRVHRLTTRARVTVRLRFGIFFPPHLNKQGFPIPDFSCAHELALYHADLVAYGEGGRARQRNGTKGAVVHAHRHAICIALLHVLLDLAPSDRTARPEERDRIATSPNRLLADAAGAARRRSGTARLIAHLDAPDGLDRAAQRTAICRGGFASGVCRPRVALLGREPAVQPARDGADTDQARNQHRNRPYCEERIDPHLSRMERARFSKFVSPAAKSRRNRWHECNPRANIDLRANSMSYRESSVPKIFDASLVNDAFPQATKIELMGKGICCRRGTTA